MSDDQFMKLFNLLEKTREEMNARFEQTASKAQAEELISAVDGYAKQAETNYQELQALGSQVDRHERWHNEAAEKIGLKLSYE